MLFRSKTSSKFECMKVHFQILMREEGKKDEAYLKIRQKRTSCWILSLERTLLSSHPHSINCNNLAKPQEEWLKEWLSSPSGKKPHLSGKEAQGALVNNVLTPLGKSGMDQTLGGKEKRVLSRMTAKPGPNHQLMTKSRHWFGSAEKNVTSLGPLFLK